MNYHFSKLLDFKNSDDCCYYSNLSISATFFGFPKIILLKNLVSREFWRILENFHFSILISKHFDFTFHFSKKSESILISLCTSRKRVKAFFFHFALLEKEWKLFIFTFHFSNFKNPLSLVPVSHQFKSHWNWNQSRSLSTLVRHKPMLKKLQSSDPDLCR